MGADLHVLVEHGLRAGNVDRNRCNDHLGQVRVKSHCVEHFRALGFDEADGAV